MIENSMRFSDVSECMYHFIGTSSVKITQYTYENQINITQYKSVSDIITNEKKII